MDDGRFVVDDCRWKIVKYEWHYKYHRQPGNDDVWIVKEVFHFGIIWIKQKPTNGNFRIWLANLALSLELKNNAIAESHLAVWKKNGFFAHFDILLLIFIIVKLCRSLACKGSLKAYTVLSMNLMVLGYTSNFYWASYLCCIQYCNAML